MLVSFANNQTMVSAHLNDAVITTDPLPVGDANNIDLVLTIHHLLAMGGAAPDVSFVVQESNDGVEWLNTGVAIVSAALGPVKIVGPLTSVFIRLKITQGVNGGAAPDWSSAAFDIHANLKHI